MTIQTLLIVVLVVLALAVRVALWYKFWKFHAMQFQTSGYTPPKAGWTSRVCMKLACRFAAFMTVGKVKVIRSKNVPTNGRVIFAANHQIPIDFAMLCRGAGRHIRLLTSADELTGFFGVISAWFGIISIAWKSKADSAAAEEACVQAVAKVDGALGIFPQGSLLPDNVLNKTEFRPGSVRIARKAEALAEQEVQIVPVAIYYERNPAKADWTHRLLKRYRSMFLGLRNPRTWNPLFKLDLSTLPPAEREAVEAQQKELLRAYKKSHVTNYGGVVVVGDPIPVSSLPADPLEAIEVIRVKMAALLETAKNS